MEETLENKIKELKQVYENQLEKFEKYLENNENTKDHNEAYWMVSGNKGMAKMIVEDLEDLLK